MRSNFKLAWLRTFKYRFDGTVFFDNILVNSNLLSVNSDFYDSKFIEKNINYEFEICKIELLESYYFINKI